MVESLYLRVLSGRKGLPLPQSPKVTIMPAAGPGSCGDYAMMDASCAVLTRELGYRVHILNHYINTRADKVRSSVKYINFRQGRHNHYLNRARDASRAALSDAIIAIGADVIDGSYNPSAILYKLNMLALGHSYGATPIIISASFSEQPNAAILDKLKSFKDLLIFSRDPISKARIEKSLGREVTLTADAAFLMTPEICSRSGYEASRWVKARRQEGARILGVNASGHTLSKMGENGVIGYIELLRRWLSADKKRALILMPHDSRQAPAGDVSALKSIDSGISEFSRDRVHFMQFPFFPWDIKAVIGDIDIVLTGRMHLAIAALGMGVAPLCLTYQGKFEGLMSHFSLSHENLLIEPCEFLKVQYMLRLLEDLAIRTIDLKQKILGKLPHVQTLAMKNFVPHLNPQ